MPAITVKATRVILLLWCSPIYNAPVGVGLCCAKQNVKTMDVGFISLL
jgi:hypothetical protein